MATETDDKQQPEGKDKDNRRRTIALRAKELRVTLYRLAAEAADKGRVATPATDPPGAYIVATERAEVLFAQAAELVGRGELLAPDTE